MYYNDLRRITASLRCTNRPLATSVTIQPEAGPVHISAHHQPV